jgi:uncharacterized membrane protein YoaK (UPF0700 family)
MTGYRLHTVSLAVMCAVLAGFVDATAFLGSSGFFVSFMSGNSTRLGVSLAAGSEEALVAALLVCSFVSGVVVGSLAAAQGRSPRTRVLLVVAAVLAAAGAFAWANQPLAAISAAAIAMGAENASFQRNGQVSIGVTYMTGALVKLGQHLTAALLGQKRTGWLPYLALWLGLIAGVVAGALSYPALQLSGLWIASGFAAVLAIFAAAAPAD